MVLDSIIRCGGARDCTFDVAQHDLHAYNFLVNVVTMVTTNISIAVTFWLFLSVA